LSRPILQGQKSSAAHVGEERRRSQRVVIRIPLTVQYTAAGHKITFKATTVSVNDHGAMLLCPRPLDVESKIEIQNEHTREKQGCRVTRSPVESTGGYLIPVEFVSPSLDFWRITFPPVNWKPLED
jgi:hypothetical protein